MISLKLTELEGGYFVPELNGHPVYHKQDCKSTRSARVTHFGAIVSKSH